MFIAITFASFFYFLLALILKKGPGLAILSLTHLKNKLLIQDHYITVC